MAVNPQTFITIKNELASARSFQWCKLHIRSCFNLDVVWYYNPNAHFKVSADAFIWAWSSSPSEVKQGMETHSIFFMLYVGSRKVLCTNRKRGCYHHFGLVRNFHDFILGSKFSIKPDHKPLILLLSTKSHDHLLLAKSSLDSDWKYTVIVFITLLARSSTQLMHFPRAPLPEEKETLDKAASIERHVEMVTENLTTREIRLAQYQAQAKIEICKQLINYCKVRWPQRHQE